MASYGRKSSGLKEQKALNSTQSIKSKLFGNNNKKDLIELIQNTFPKGSSNRGSVTKYD